MEAGQIKWKANKSLYDTNILNHANKNMYIHVSLMGTPVISEQCVGSLVLVCERDYFKQKLDTTLAWY